MLTLVNTTKRLGGDELKWVFDEIEKRHYAIKAKYGRKGEQYAKEWSPLVNELKQGQAYIVYPNDHIRLWDIPMLPFHHKNPDQHWEQITGIHFGWSKETISTDGSNSSKTDEKLLFSLIYEKRNSKNGKVMKWKEVIDYLALEQQKGTIVWDKPFNEMKPFFGFTIAGMIMLIVVVVAAFSAIDRLGFSSSEKSISQEVDSAMNLDDPQMCMNFDEPQFCVSNLAYMKKDPGMCNSMLTDEEDQYECLGKFFRIYLERVCDYVADNYYSKCLAEAQNWKR